jgi:hypothetical protein
MLNKSRTAVSALLAIGFAGALAGSWTGPASAAPGQVCYFGECSTSATPVAPAPSAQSSEARTLPKHGSWKAVVIGQGSMIVDEFDNGAKFAILAYPEGKIGLLLSHPDWRLKRGQQIELTVRIDGEVFKGTAVINEKGFLEVDGVGKAFVAALYRGRKGQIEVGDYRFDMTNLADAAAAIDDLVRYQQTVSR